MLIVNFRLTWSAEYNRYGDSGTLERWKAPTRSDQYHILYSSDGRSVFRTTLVARPIRYGIFTATYRYGNVLSSLVVLFSGHKMSADPH
jgi:hypothetical protein